MGKDLFTKLIESENARDAYRRKWMDEVELGKVLEKENATIKAQNAELQELGDTMSEGFDKVTDECMGLRAQVPRWRSVEDGLPKETGYFLVSYPCKARGNKRPMVDRFWCKHHGFDMFGFEDITVTHWMPLPAPPEGGQP
jgi:hypothetical protein